MRKNFLFNPFKLDDLQEVFVNRHYVGPRRKTGSIMSIHDTQIHSARYLYRTKRNFFQVFTILRTEKPQLKEASSVHFFVFYNLSDGFMNR